MQIKISDKNVWLNCNHLYYFYIIAKEGSITKASKILSLGLPTLSAQLKQLEATLGKELFTRNNNKMTLTETGSLVVSFAHEIFVLGKRMGEAISATASDKINLKFGIQSSVGKSQLIDIFKAVRSFDNLNITVQEESTEDLFNLLYSHKLDLIMTNDLPAIVNYGNLITKKISKSPIVVCGDPSFQKLAKGFPHSLSSAPFIMPLPTCKLRKDMDHYFNRHAVTVDLVGETQDAYVQKMLAKDGVGLIYTSQSQGEELLSEGLVEIGRPIRVYEETYLVYSKETADDSPIRKLVQLLG